MQSFLTSKRRDINKTHNIIMEYKTKTNLILPFKGVLWVSNGGRTAETNSHNRSSDLGPQNQLYAYDFRTKTTGKEKTLEEFPVFGLEVLNPGDGVIVQIINGAIDIIPGERDRSVGVGNAIVIDHQTGEFSLLCHFKFNSIRVKVGDKIKQGDVLGLCGNTGNTFQPHIHFNLQDGPLMHKAKALPAQFVKIMVDGQEKTCFEPIRGQHVSNPTV